MVSQGFGLQGGVAHHPRRNVTPPELSSPGPFDADCYLSTLAAYPDRSRVRVKISRRARTRPGRIRFHLSSFLIKSHRLRLSLQHLRLTPSTKRKRVSRPLTPQTPRAHSFALRACIDASKSFAASTLTVIAVVPTDTGRSGRVYHISPT